MSSQFPKLQAKFDEILSEFNKILEAKIESGDIEEVKLSISSKNFVPRLAKASLPNIKGTTKKDPIAEDARAERNDGRIVNVIVVDAKERIIIYAEQRYQCKSKKTLENGDVLYANCNIL